MRIRQAEAGCPQGGPSMHREPQGGSRGSAGPARASGHRHAGPRRVTPPTWVRSSVRSEAASPLEREAVAPEETSPSENQPPYSSYELNVVVAWKIARVPGSMGLATGLTVASAMERPSSPEAIVWSTAPKHGPGRVASRVTRRSTCHDYSSNSSCEIQRRPGTTTAAKSPRHYALADSTGDSSGPPPLNRTNQASAP
jgi:hypothetical protein